jgi:hypothetical protein
MKFILQFSDAIIVSIKNIMPFIDLADQEKNDTQFAIVLIIK